MNSPSINPALEEAAKKTLIRLTRLEDTLTPLYLQPDRAIFLAEERRIILKVYIEGTILQREYATAQKAASIGIPIPKMLGLEIGEPTVLAMEHIPGHPLSSRNPDAAKEAGRYLQRFHSLEAQPPFSGGQQQWDAFIFWWRCEELEKVKRLGVFEPWQISKLQAQFDHLQPLLEHRPIVLLHGDLQPVHILIDPQTEHVQAFLDFADAQPGDPLLDIAVLTLWDHRLTERLLEGYGSIVYTEETQQLLSFYRLLRQMAEIPWLLERGFKAMAERNIVALKENFL